tara:strand:- start:3543 stop:3734 length:192 start_codon:yes stop_codon:yes gene_type:complete
VRRFYVGDRVWVTDITTGEPLIAANYRGTLNGMAVVVPEDGGQFSIPVDRLRHYEAGPQEERA